MFNTGGYDRVRTLKSLEGKVQIYLPDMKYATSSLAARFSAAPGYPDIAAAAIEEMYRQTGDYFLDGKGMMKSALIIRHLILPGETENSIRVLDWIKSVFSGCKIMVSLMSQYTPCGEAAKYPPLDRAITKREFLKVQEHLFDTGLTDGYIQEPSSGSADYIPVFDLEGV